jgi:hypothetical protein
MNAGAGRYWLSKHVHLCLSGDKVVLLDLRRNRYSTFDSVDASPLSRFVAGWPAASPDAAAAALSEDEDAFRDLLQNQLVTAEPEAGKEAAPLVFPTAAAELLQPRDIFDDPSVPRYAVRGRCRTAFLVAVTGALAKRRCLRLERQVRHVERRRAQSLWATEEFDLDELREVAATFFWLRPWGYPAKDQCLLDSLALIDYLAWFGFYPHWVFGVKTAPFAAHCWVQAGPVVLNDHLSRTQEFTPILAA